MHLKTEAEASHQTIYFYLPALFLLVGSIDPCNTVYPSTAAQLHVRVPLNRQTFEAFYVVALWPVTSASFVDRTRMSRWMLFINLSKSQPCTGRYLHDPQLNDSSVVIIQVFSRPHLALTAYATHSVTGANGPNKYS